VTTRRAVILAVIAAVLIASAAVRLVRLGTPDDYIFDEVYYAKDAKALLDGRIGPEKGTSWLPGDEISWPHPYYGKLAIAAGIALFGDNAFGWRFAPALAGIALLALVYPTARRLGLRREWALLALILAAADVLGIAQSRIATLDIFLGLWTILTVYLTLRAVQGRHRVVWLALAGLSAGMALGTKWSGLLASLAALALVLVLSRASSDRSAEPPSVGADVALETDRDGAAEGDPHESAAEDRRTRRHSTAHRWVPSRTTVGRALTAVALLVVLPCALYVASYGVYFAAGHGLADWWHLQREMWTFNMNLDATHTYASLAPTWILDVRPVWYHFEEYAAQYYGVVAMGHPILWWASIVALLTLPVVALVDRDRDLALPVLLVALLYFPWFAATRTSFLYYMTPVAPFLAIMVAAALARLAGRPPRLRPDGPGGESLTIGPPKPLRRAARRRGLPPSLVWRAAVFLGTAVVIALFWWQIGRLVATVFYEWPATLAPAVGIAVATVAGAAAVLILAWAFTRPGMARAWRYVAWAFCGAIVGFAIVFAPIVLDIPLVPDEFYRRIWLPTWL